MLDDHQLPFHSCVEDRSDFEDKTYRTGVWWLSRWKVPRVFEPCEEICQLIDSKEKRNSRFAGCKVEISVGVPGWHNSSSQRLKLSAPGVRQPDDMCKGISSKAALMGDTDAGMQLFSLPLFPSNVQTKSVPNLILMTNWEHLALNLQCTLVTLKHRKVSLSCFATYLQGDGCIYTDWDGADGAPVQWATIGSTQHCGVGTVILIHSWSNAPMHHLYAPKTLCFVNVSTNVNVTPQRSCPTDDTCRAWTILRISTREQTLKPKGKQIRVALKKCWSASSDKVASE